MISVGIDVSKGKSTVCILRPNEDYVCKPFELLHCKEDLELLDALLKKLDGEVKIVMEATGIYNLPILTFLIEKSYFVSVINPCVMKKYARNNNFRNVKTDKQDSVTIAKYGIEKWFKLQKYECSGMEYEELKLLGRRYRHYMEMHVVALQELTHMLDYVMPGIKDMFTSRTESNNRDKLCDFVERFWHYDLITSMNCEDFVVAYLDWAKQKKYHQNKSKAKQVYELASNGIPTLPSNIPSTKMLVLEAICNLRTIDDSLNTILTRMNEIAKSLPEYSTVQAMGRVGDVLSVKLIAEIGDVRRFHSAKALVAYAGIDPPPYESGQFVGTKRKITKRGSSTLRKVGYELMRVLKAHGEPQDAVVYNYILKKEKEGKSKKQAKIAGLNKFLHIYYARVMEVYQQV